MHESEIINLKSDVQRFLRERGAFKVRVANPRVGFEKAVKGCHPLDVMKEGKSVVVFATYIGLDYYRTVKIEGKTVGDNRIGHIFRDWLAYELVEFLRTNGFRAAYPSGFFDRPRKMARMSFKLAAHEAGIGVYGRPGIIITPEYGPRVNIGVVVTDAMLEPDEKLEFNPCESCRVCVEVCPVQAIRGDLVPPISHNRGLCLSFVDRLRDEAGDKNFLCGYCYDRCPVGGTKKRGYLISRYRRLVNLRRSERERLIQRSLPSQEITKR